MFDTVSISELQRSLSKILKSTKGIKIILTNNKMQGLLVDKKLARYLEESGALEEYEDEMLLEEGKEESLKARVMLENNDFSDSITFDELC